MLRSLSTGTHGGIREHIPTIFLRSPIPAAADHARSAGGWPYPGSPQGEGTLAVSAELLHPAAERANIQADIMRDLRARQVRSVTSMTASILNSRG
jgi:hypothetical protein